MLSFVFHYYVPLPVRAGYRRNSLSRRNISNAHTHGKKWNAADLTIPRRFMCLA